MLPDVNPAIFIPIQQEDKGSSVLLFITCILHVIRKAIQNSEKASCSMDNSCGKVRQLFYIKNEPQRGQGALLVGGEGLKIIGI